MNNFVKPWDRKGVRPFVPCDLFCGASSLTRRTGRRDMRVPGREGDWIGIGVVSDGIVRREGWSEVKVSQKGLQGKGKGSYKKRLCVRNCYRKKES